MECRMVTQNTMEHTYSVWYSHFAHGQAINVLFFLGWIAHKVKYCVKKAKELRKEHNKSKWG